ncbi:MAG: hypothetical protein KAW66_08470 [Candidatus Lokiarchaeota archaeon]|jgi:hypothetical protein|nr:hypothetical protein [Candidatus Lokiarchaeota archaeon]
MVKEIKLRNGLDVEYDEQAPITLYEIIISEVLIPKYKQNKDWNLTINIILEEMNEMISKYELDPKLKLGLLNQVEEHLDKDIEELTGCDKIEILFMNMDDFVEDIEKLICSGRDKQELRNDMANLIFPLTVFELGELFIYLGKRAFLK